MQAGCKLDALVAEKVTQWDRKHKYVYCEDGWYAGCSYCSSEQREKSEDEFKSEQCEGYPPYSSDIAAAWEVVDRLKDEGWTAHVWSYGGGRCAGCALHRGTDDQRTPPVDADTVPLAICLAALKAVEPPVEA